MKTKYKYYILNIVTAIAVTMFFSCKNNLKNVQKMGMSENEPIGVAEGFNYIYTDSGKVKANLISSKMLDFTNRNFPFREFPEGVTLYLYDEKNEKITVLADFAIVYEKTELIDLQSNVVIVTQTNDTLFAEQLYCDQKKEWLFTNKPVKYKQADGITNGIGFDANKDFSFAEVLEMTGDFTIDE